MGKKSPFDQIIDACEKGDDKSLNCLLNNLPNRAKAINCHQKKCGYTPLIVAVRNNKGDCVRLLLERGAHPDSPDVNGMSPLLHAIQHLNYSFVKLLLKKKANPNFVDQKGNVPIHYASTFTTTHKYVKILMKKGAKVNAAIRSSGLVAVHYAAEQNKSEALRYMLAHGANPNDTNREGLTPLHFACKNGALDSFKVLLSFRVNINKSNKEGLNPLHYACQTSDEMVQILLSLGADTQKRTVYNDTVLHFAAANKSPFCAMLVAPYFVPDQAFNMFNTKNESPSSIAKTYSQSTYEVLQNSDTFNPTKRTEVKQGADRTISMSTRVRAKAVADFTASLDGQISMKKGDIVDIIEEKASGWWMCKNGMYSGFLPSTYLVKLESDSISRAPLPSPILGDPNFDMMNALNNFTLDKSLDSSSDSFSSLSNTFAFGGDFNAGDFNNDFTGYTGLDDFDDNSFTNNYNNNDSANSYTSFNDSNNGEYDNNNGYDNYKEYDYNNNGYEDESQIPLEIDGDASWIIQHEQIKMEQKLGGGGCGVVYKAKWLGTDVAVKELLGGMTKAALDEFIQEAKLASSLHYPHVVHMYGITKTPPYYMVMEYMDKGSLYHCVTGENISFDRKVKIALGIAKGLHFLHKRDIIHRDMKSLNVLLNDRYEAKLADFGLSTVKSTRTSGPTANDGGVGTIHWKAPELLRISGKHTIESDVYAMGLVFWELIAGKLPYENADDEVQIRLHVVDGGREEIPDDCPEWFRNLIEGCWHQDPTSRFTTDQVIAILEKPNTAPTNNGQNASRFASNANRAAPTDNTYRSNSSNNFNSNTGGNRGNNNGGRGNNFNSNAGGNRGNFNSNGGNNFNSNGGSSGFAGFNSKNNSSGGSSSGFAGFNSNNYNSNNSNAGGSSGFSGFNSGVNIGGNNNSAQNLNSGRLLNSNNGQRGGSPYNSSGGGWMFSSKKN